MNHAKTKILLIYNPYGVVDKDIYLSAQNGTFEVKSLPIAVSKSPEGHTVETIDLLSVAKTIVSFNPDFVLTINGAGLDNDGLLAHFCAYMKIPLVLWYVDEPFIVPEWGQKFIPETAIAFTFDRFYEKRLKEWGIPWVYTLPLGANSERMLSYGRVEHKETSFSNPVSFVGTLDYEKIRYLLDNISREWESMPPEMVDVLEKTINRYRANPKKETEEIIRICADEHGVEFEFPNGIVKQMILSFIDREASFRLRHEIVEGLKPFGISVYGESFWQKAVGKECYRGTIDYYSGQIARLYRSSRININISKYQLKTTVNQRVFDCPLCGGFLVTDYKEDIEEYFDIEKSIIVYHDQDDLRKKVAFYLDNENETKRVVERGKETILTRHTYHHRLVEIANIIRRTRSQSGFNVSCSKALAGPSPPRFQPLIEKLREETFLACGADALRVPSTSS